MLEFALGGLFRIVPELFKLIDREKERQHERQMVDLQLKLDEKRAELELKQITVTSENEQQLAELKALIEATKATSGKLKGPTGIWLVDTLIGFAEAANAFVRPILTYWYCVLAYGAYKGALLYITLASGSTVDNAILSVWTETDYKIMISIIGFWFVDRALRKMKV